MATIKELGLKSHDCVCPNLIVNPSPKLTKVCPFKHFKFFRYGRTRTLGGNYLFYLEQCEKCGVTSRNVVHKEIGRRGHYTIYPRFSI